MTSILTQFHANLANGPCGIVAHRNKVGVQVLPQDREKLGHEGMHMGETGLSQITKQGKRRLAHLKNYILFVMGRSNSFLSRRRTSGKTSCMHW